MKPYIFKIKGVDAYFKMDHYGHAELTSDIEQATIYRSSKVTPIEDMRRRGRIEGIVNWNDIELADTMAKAGYHYTKPHAYIFQIPDAYLEKMPVKEKEITPTDITGDYVIKIKGTGIYVYKKYLTMRKEDATVWSNPKTDPIGKMERGMNISGKGTMNLHPGLNVEINYGGHWGPEVIKYLQEDPEGIKLSKELHCTESEESYTLEKCFDRSWRGCYQPAFIPVEYLEREKL